MPGGHRAGEDAARLLAQARRGPTHRARPARLAPLEQARRTCSSRRRRGRRRTLARRFGAPAGSTQTATRSPVEEARLRAASPPTSSRIAAGARLDACRPIPRRPRRGGSVRRPPRSTPSPRTTPTTRTGRPFGTGVRDASPQRRPLRAAVPRRPAAATPSASAAAPPSAAPARRPSRAARARPEQQGGERGSARAASRGPASPSTSRQPRPKGAAEAEERATHGGRR